MTLFLRVVRLALAVVGAMLIASEWPANAQTPTPTPPPGGDCCAAHGGPGCDVPQCQACVCGLPDQDVCCGDTWDATCAEIASNPDECAANCPCTPLPTATVTPTQAAPTPGGDCCAAHAGASCDSSRCAECVCDVSGQDVCCTEEWDVTCAEVAAVECSGFCPCDSAECCTAHDSPGCDGTVCEECVCDLPGQDFCCDGEEGFWDETCASAARNVDECLGSCACEPEDCCSPHADPGCESTICLDCVCAADPECCTLIWDQGCVDLATSDDECGGFCPCGIGDCCAAHDGIGCVGAVCEECVCNTPGQEACCTDGWDDTCADVAADPDDCAGSCACADADCCTQHTDPGCGDVECLDCVCALDPQCCDAEWDGICAARAQEECAGRCPCGSGDCCATREDPGCGESVCEDCVCEFDPVCCAVDGQWDEDCVIIATNAEQCSDECSCTDCCSEQDVPGCDDSGCAECVCNVSGQEVCCSEVWDAQCADVAMTECAASCPCGGGGCVGDCNGSGDVTVSELVRGVNILLETAAVTECPAFDANDSGDVAINELVQGVNNLLLGCS